MATKNGYLISLVDAYSRLYQVIVFASNFYIAFLFLFCLVLFKGKCNACKQKCYIFENKSNIILSDSMKDIKYSFIIQTYYVILCTGFLVLFFILLSFTTE